jgi:hypothetical protein
VKGANAAQVASRLDLRRTGRSAAAAPVAGLTIPGWYVVVAQGSEDRIASARSLARWTDMQGVAAGFLEEHVMASRCEFWVQGRRHWTVEHRGENGTGHLATTGRPPEVFATIKAAALARQQSETGDVDHLYDVPLELAQAVAGFRPDDMRALETEVLEESAGRRAWRASRRWRLGITLLGMLLVLGMLMGAILDVVARALRFVAGLLR